MLKKSVLATLLALTTSSVFAAVYPANPSPFYTSDKLPWHVFQNQTFHLELKVNPSMGYSWHVVKFDKNLVTLLGHEYISPNSHYKPWRGMPGYDVWAFRAKSANYSVNQVGHIVMAYGDKTMAFTINVNKNNPLKMIDNNKCITKDNYGNCQTYQGQPHFKCVKENKYRGCEKLLKVN